MKINYVTYEGPVEFAPHGNGNSNVQPSGL